jgi:hypothetical protein
VTNRRFMTRFHLDDDDDLEEDDDFDDDEDGNEDDEDEEDDEDADTETWQVSPRGDVIPLNGASRLTSTAEVPRLTGDFPAQPNAGPT